MAFTKFAAVALLCSSVARAHIALFSPGMFGLNYPYQADDPSNTNYNNNEPVNPLRRLDNFTTAQWWGHGLKGYPPAAGNFLTLESGGTYVGELACNRAFTTMRDPVRTDVLEYNACPDIGPLHQMNAYNTTFVDPKWFGGTALAIAYTSDVANLQPNDMTVISINQTAVWTRITKYNIPAGLPPCPAGGCLCTWNWIHEATHGEGYGPEIYNVLYRCTVTGATNSNNVIPIGKATVPVKCDTDPTKCVKGPKMPMYLYQVDGNNMPDDDGNNPPTYNNRYGFYDGAQNDVFNAAVVVPSSSSSASSAASSSMPVSSSSMPAASSSKPASSSSTPIGSSSIPASSSSKPAASSSAPASSGSSSVPASSSSSMPASSSKPASSSLMSSASGSSSVPSSSGASSSKASSASSAPVPSNTNVTPGSYCRMSAPAGAPTPSTCAFSYKRRRLDL